MNKAFDIFYHVYLGCILIMVNVYFFIFIHFIPDLAPNFALAMFTLPFSYMEFKKVIRLVRKTE